MCLPKRVQPMPLHIVVFEVWFTNHTYLVAKKLLTDFFRITANTLSQILYESYISFSSFLLILYTAPSSISPAPVFSRAQTLSIQQLKQQQQQSSCARILNLNPSHESIDDVPAEHASRRAALVSRPYTQVHHSHHT